MTRDEVLKMITAMLDFDKQKIEIDRVIAELTVILERERNANQFGLAIALTAISTVNAASLATLPKSSADLQIDLLRDLADAMRERKDQQPQGSPDAGQEPSPDAFPLTILYGKPPEA